MAQIKKIQFEREGCYYELEIDLDDGELMNDLLVFELAATVTNRDRITHTETVGLEINFPDGIITVSKPDTLAAPGFKHVIQIDDLLDPIQQMGEEVVDLSAMDHNSVVMENAVGTSVEGMITAVPAFDPIIGCLIKAGLSSLVGQALVCRQETLDPQEGRRKGVMTRAREIGRCLRKHSGGIARSIFVRYFRCCFTLGYL